MRRSPPPSRGPTRARIARGVRALVALAVATPLVVVALRNVALAGRMFAGETWFPAELEWMEGGQLYHGYRLLHGLPLYGDCSDGFIPFPYPPVHPALLALLGRFVALDYGPARLVSIVAVTVAALLVAREVFVAGEGGARGAVFAAVALGAMAVSYPIAGNWYDKIRVDSLFVALLLAGAVASLPPANAPARRPLGAVRTVGAALLLTAAVFTKQTGAFFIPWICLFALWRHRASGIALTAATACGCALTLAALQIATEGRFWMYVFEVMARHVTSLDRGLWSLWRLLLFARFLPLLPLVALWLWHRRRLRSRTTFWLGMLAVAMVASAVTTVKLTAYLNNVMTGALLCWPVGVMVAADLLRSMRPRSARRLAWLTGLGAYAAVQLFHRGFEPKGYLPTEAEWRGARAANRLVRRLGGDLLAPAHPFLPIRQGQRGRQIHRQGYLDVLEAGVPEIDVATCLAGIRADFVLIDEPPEPYFDAVLLMDYEAPAPVPDAMRVGPGIAHPDRIYRRKPDAPSSLERRRRRLLFDFEVDGFVGWTTEGKAFRAGPASGARWGQWPVLGHLGRGLASSFDPALGSWALGTLRSPPFLVDRTHLGLRIGGGRSPKLRVRLEVEGRTVRRFDGPGYDVDMLVPHVWEVSALASREAHIVIEDEEDDRNGHILVDEIELFDGVPRTRGGERAQ